MCTKNIQALPQFLHGQISLLRFENACIKQKSLHKIELKGAGYRWAAPSFYLTTKHPLGPYNQRKKVRPKMHNLTNVNVALPYKCLEVKMSKKM